MAARVLHHAFPALKIVGTRHGYFDKTANSVESDGVIRHINDVRPDILVVGFGMPVQEQWLADNWTALDVSVALTGGAVFDYVSGTLRRPPKWMQGVGLEWLGRMLIEPRRLWRRYVVGNPLFMARVVKAMLVPQDRSVHPRLSH
jgi:N-acetylglucosaminyldiphosphoundecaprenol N-acetyl-beta-D-mannosaminyltransferase